jgi:hypothetical protein
MRRGFLETNVEREVARLSEEIKMNSRWISPLGAVLALGGCLFGLTPASASTFSGHLFCTDPVSGSPTPVSQQCSFSSDVTLFDGKMNASPGHLGTQMNGSEQVGGGVASQAGIAVDDLVFSAPGGTTLSTIPVALNLAVTGRLATSGIADVEWRLLAEGMLGFDYLTEVGSDANHSQSGIGFTSGGESTGAGTDTVGGVLTSDFFNLPVGTPISFTLLLTVSGFGGDGGSFHADFLDSVDFPIGANAFNLPDGFTANAPSQFIVNNRFTPTVAAPEPSTWAMVTVGFCGLAWFARQRRQRCAREVAGPLKRRRVLPSQPPRSAAF